MKQLITTKDIVIPAGTLLDTSPAQRRGGVETSVGFGPNFTGYLYLKPHPDALASGYFKEVTEETLEELNAKATQGTWRFQENFSNIYVLDGDSSGLTAHVAKFSCTQVAGGFVEAESNAKFVTALVNNYRARLKESTEIF